MWCGWFGAKRRFLQIRNAHFSGKFDSGQFDPLNFHSVSTGSKDVIDFVFELA